MWPYGVTATVTRSGGTDRHGDPLPTTEHAIEGCAPAPAGSTEETDRALTVEWDLDLLLPYGADVRAEDHVTLEGDVDPDGVPVRYRVHGRPARWRHPMTGWEPGEVARLKATTG